MSFEPQKFFIGLMSFFSILLPGALAAFLLMDWAPQVIGFEKYKGLTTEAKWITFFVSSYLLGHFIFLIGAFFLDEYVYDKIRAYPVKKQVQSLAKGGGLSPRWLRNIAQQIFKKDSDEALFKAIRIKERYLEPLNASSSINTFQWSKARLAIENPGALANVQQFEADAKFFRSLIVVLVAFLFFSVFQVKIGTSVLLFIFIALALWRYVDQRLKSVTQGYWYIITMESTKPGNAEIKKTSAAKNPTHAGGVVYRYHNEQIEFLLVQALANSDEWVLPKGHIESEENPRHTAVREVREETNIWAKVKQEIGVLSFAVDDKSIETKIYLMEFVEEGRQNAKRERLWLPKDEAINKASKKETKNILKLAYQQLLHSGILFHLKQGKRKQTII